MNTQQRRRFFSSRNLVRLAPGAVFLLILVFAGGLRAYQKGSEGRPEWRYLGRMALEKPSQSMGGDTMCFGYLPGFSAFVRPFFIHETVGLLAYIGMNIASCLGIFWILRRWMTGRSGMAALAENDVDRAFDRARGDACDDACGNAIGDDFDHAWNGWILVSLLAGPSYLAIQNNQVVAPAVFLLLAAWTMIEGNRRVSAAVLLAFSCLLKTLPITFVGYFLLTRRLVPGVLTVVFLAVLSFAACAALFGVSESVQSHRRFPQNVQMQEPARAVANMRPVSYGNNQSIAAMVIKSKVYIGDAAAMTVRYGILVASAVVVAFYAFRFGKDPGHARATFLMWLAWTVFAAPFGRYYYLLFLVPVWVGDEPLRRRMRQFPWLLPVALVLGFAARNEEVLIPVVAATFVLAARRAGGLRPARKEGVVSSE